jgi:Disulphide bond corrector protein DsbC
VFGLLTSWNGPPTFGQADLPEPVPLEAPEAVAGSLVPDSIFISQDASEQLPPIAQYRARLVVATGGEEAQLRVTARLAEGLHTYPLTDSIGRQTRLELAPGPFLAIAGPAQPDRTPDEPADPSADSAGSYRGQIEFVVPLMVLATPPNDDWQIYVRINGLLCSDDGYCVPVQNQVLRAAVEKLPELSRPADPSGAAPMAPPER